MADLVSILLCVVLPVSVAIVVLYKLLYGTDEIKRHAQAVRRRWQYRRYLRSGAWQALRKQVLRRAGWRCEDCSKRGPLDVHHLTYERFGHERLSDLTALCRECHTQRHQRR